MGRTLERIIKRVEQTLQVVVGVKEELYKCADSVRSRLETNPSLTRDPRGKEAFAAAEAGINTASVFEALEKRFGREPTEEMKSVELKLAIAKEVKRREVLNRPVVEALVELEETAIIGSGSLEDHEAKVRRQLAGLWEVYNGLKAHYEGHHTVANAVNRATCHRMIDHPTHEALKLAADREDTARLAANQAVKAAQLEKSRLEAYKADVQRAMLARTKKTMEFKRVDAQGTTFKAWSAEELKMGAE